MKTRTASFKGTVERHSDAVGLLSAPGDMVLVKRGVDRLLIFSCPDGCGDIVPVNLDPRADKAWRYYCRADKRTLFPSVWRDEGCRAHFILWNNAIFWTGLDHFGSDPQQSSELRKSVANRLELSNWKSYTDIANDLDEIPWAVLVACEELVKIRYAEQASGQNRGQFRRKSR